MDVVEGSVGPEAKYEVDVVEGKVVVKLVYVGAESSALLQLDVGLVELLRKAAKKTDNTIDDAMVEMIANALK